MSSISSEPKSALHRVQKRSSGVESILCTSSSTWKSSGGGASPPDCCVTVVKFLVDEDDASPCFLWVDVALMPAGVDRREAGGRELEDCALWRPTQEVLLLLPYDPDM